MAGGGSLIFERVLMARRCRKRAADAKTSPNLPRRLQNEAAILSSPSITARWPNPRNALLRPHWKNAFLTQNRRPRVYSNKKRPGNRAGQDTGWRRRRKVGLRASECFKAVGADDAQIRKDWSPRTSILIRRRSISCPIGSQFSPCSVGRCTFTQYHALRPYLQSSSTSRRTAGALGPMLVRQLGRR